MPAWASAEIFPKWGSREEDYETSVSEIKSKRTFVKSCITQRKNIKNQSSTSLATILTVEVRLLTASPSDHDCFFPLMPLLQTATGVGAPYRQAHFLIIANQFQIYHHDTTLGKKKKKGVLDRAGYAYRQVAD